MSFEPMLQQQRKHGSLMPSNILYFLLLRIVFGTLVAGAQPAPKQVVLKPARPATAGEDGSRPYYKLGDSIPVSCLNRTLSVEIFLPFSFVLVRFLISLTALRGVVVDKCINLCR